MIAAIFELPGAAIDPGNTFIYDQVASAIAAVFVGPITYIGVTLLYYDIAHPQGRLRHRDARALAVRRLLVGGVVGVALMTAARGSGAGAAAATCVTIDVHRAARPRGHRACRRARCSLAALTARHPGRGPGPSSSPMLAPIIAGADGVATRRHRQPAAHRPAGDARSRCRPGRRATSTPRQAENALHQVYASSVFADLDQNQPPSIFERIGAAINWILSHLFGLLGSGGSIVLGLLVLAVDHRLRRLPPAWRRRRPTRAGNRHEPATAGDDPEREWRLALAAAQRGDHREAIRRAFRSALLDVTDRRAHLDRAWTTREMLATLSVDADLLAVVAPAAASFDRAWYGAVPVSAADWEIARARCEAVRAVARQPQGRRRP